jgi:hypothetical protein
MTNADSKPPAWQAALERFEGGYGAPFDPEEPGDIVRLVQLLEEEIHRQITSELVESFNRATARIKEQMRALEQQRQ